MAVVLKEGQLKTKSILLPTSILSGEKLQEIRNLYIKKLIEATLGEMPEDNLVIRDLMPTDLVLAQDDWRMTTGATARVWANSSIAAVTIADNRFVCIWGVSDISGAQAIGGLRITNAGTRVAIWSLDHLWAYPDNMGGIALSPVIVKQNLVLTIEWYVKYPNAPVEFVLDGAVCEKEGLALKI